MRQALVERYPRERFVLADKMPILRVKAAEDYPRFFDETTQPCENAEAEADELTQLRTCMYNPGVVAWPDGEVLLPELGKPGSGESGYE